MRKWQHLCWFGAGSPSCSGLVPVGIPQALLPSDSLCHWEGLYGENGSSAVFLEIMPARRRAPGSPRPAGKGPELGHLASLLKAIVKGQGFLGEVPGYQGWHGESLMPRKGSSSRKPSCTALLGTLPGLVLLPCGPRFLPRGPISGKRSRPHLPSTRRSHLPSGLSFCQTHKEAHGLASSWEKGQGC